MSVRRESVIASAAIAAALNPLNSTMVAVALPAISAEFGADPSTVTLTVITGYLVTTLISQMPAGSLADRIGYRRTLSIGRWILLAGALAGAIAPLLGAVVGARLLMAVGGSLMVPTAMALVRVAVPAERRPRAFGAMGAIMGGAAAIGPALGAWMGEFFGWRSLFLVNIPLLAISWILQPAGRADVAPSDQARTFDWPGSVLIGAALVLLTTATRITAPLAFGVAAAGVVLCVTLVWHERRTPAPVLPLPLFLSGGFSAGAGVIALQNLAMYSLLIQVPFLFGGGRAADSRIGLAIIAMTATFAATAPLGGWLAERLGARPVVIAGGLLGAYGVFEVAQLPATALPVQIGARLLLVGLGLGLSTGPAQAVALSAAPPDQSGRAAATVSMLRYLGSVAGTVILGYALAPGSDGASRHHIALGLFVGAFVLSAALGAALQDSRV